MTTSKIPTIYDNLATVIAGALAGYRRIANPYEPEANSELSLAKGFGIGIGQGDPLGGSLGKQRIRARTFNVMLIQQVTTTDHNITARAAIEKQLIDDIFAVENAIEADNTLSGVVIKADWTGDSGLTFLSSDVAKFLTTSMSFLVTYQETLP